MENIKNGYKQIIKALDAISDTSEYVSINTVKVLLGENIGKYIAESEENSNSAIKVGDYVKTKSSGTIGTVKNITGRFVSIRRNSTDNPFYTTIDDLELIVIGNELGLMEAEELKTINAESVKRIICNPNATVENLREFISKLDVDQLKEFAVCCDRFTFFEDPNSTHDVLLQINAILGSQMANYYIEQKIKEAKSVKSKLENAKAEDKEDPELQSIIASIDNLEVPYEDIKKAVYKLDIDQLEKLEKHCSTAADSYTEKEYDLLERTNLVLADCIKKDIYSKTKAVKSKLENAKSDSWLGENFSDTEIKVIQTVALLKAKSQLLARKLSKKVKDTIKNNL